MKKLIIIHYHLNPGGVTRIIESQVQGLREQNPDREIMVLAGDCQDKNFFRELGVEVRVDSRINYLPGEANIKSMYNELGELLTKIIKADDIIHFHNLNLGKNPVLTWIIHERILAGQLVINHAHDFAEDRPLNFQFLQHVIGQFTDEKLHNVLYTDLPSFYHACLNTPDLERLIRYGVRKEKCYLLPNPVVFNIQSKIESSGFIKTKICQALNLNSSKLLITYPVRVIRRKNIGEYILLCWLFRDQANWMVTQPPKNPVEIEYYNRWKEFCKQENIPLLFEVGNEVDFEELITGSDFCFTTSIQEGFGMVYMEPWLLNTPVIGRNLINITPDLKESGMQFPLLYDQLLVKVNSQEVDFGMLSMEQQMDYISRLISKPETEKELFSCNRYLENLLNSIDQTLIEKNKITILQEYSLANYAQKLERLYQAIAG